MFYSAAILAVFEHSFYSGAWLRYAWRDRWAFLAASNDPGLSLGARGGAAGCGEG